MASPSSKCPLKSQDTLIPDVFDAPLSTPRTPSFATPSGPTLAASVSLSDTTNSSLRAASTVRSSNQHSATSSRTLISDGSLDSVSKEKLSARLRFTGNDEDGTVSALSSTIPEEPKQLEIFPQNPRALLKRDGGDAFESQSIGIECSLQSSSIISALALRPAPLANTLCLLHFHQPWERGL